MKGIDHLVLCGIDLEAMRERYAALGFTLTPLAQHPFGTRNSLVQLDNVFIELLSVAQPEKIPEHRPGHFSFAAFNRDFLKQGEGLSMLVLDSVDARADTAFYRRHGLETYQPFDFSRRAKLPTGDNAVVSFSLAFVADPQMPRCGFFCCQQHAPQYFWQPYYQDHPNGAQTVLEVALVAQRPREIKAFLEHFSGYRAEAAGDGLRIATKRGKITVHTPEGFHESYSVPPPDLGEGPRFGGFTIGLTNTSPRRDLFGETIELFGAAIRFKAMPVAA
jgi:glyoxalase-like protein